MQVSDILDHKGGSVVTVRSDDTIDTFVHKLNLERIGAAVVSDDGARVQGIISERDVARGLAEHRRELLGMPVSKLMSRDVLTCGPEDSVKDVMAKMTQRRVRHLPVMADGKLVGVISIGDVVKNRLDDMEMETNVLRDYVIAHN